MTTDYIATVHPRSFCSRLLYCLGTLVILHVIAMVAWYEDLFPVEGKVVISLFDLNGAESFGTWFSSIILFLSAITTYFIAALVKKQGQAHYCWWILASGLLIMSIDELAAVHEYFNGAIEYAHWTSVGIILVMCIGVFFTPFLLLLPKKTSRLFMLAGAVYLGGAMGIEWATVYHEKHDLLDTLTYKLWNALEEGLEMMGVLIYQYASLSYLASSTMKPLSIRCVFKNEIAN